MAGQCEGGGVGLEGINTDLRLVQQLDRYANSARHCVALK